MKHPTTTRRRAGFTLVEVLVASSLMTTLAILVATTWSALGRPLVESVARAQIAQEASLAASALSRDFGGYLAGQDGRVGGVADGLLVGCVQVNHTILRLCFDEGSPADGLAEWDAPDRVISYQVQDGNLVRWDEQSGNTFVVARFVEEIALNNVDAGIEIKLTFVRRGWTRVVTLVGVTP
jgi:prepilin-type N-terminal cleavage/methylation domain-containing protein